MILFKGKLESNRTLYFVFLIATDQRPIQVFILQENNNDLLDQNKINNPNMR